MERRLRFILILFFLVSGSCLLAQEVVAPLEFNGAIIHNNRKVNAPVTAANQRGAQQKTTAIGLPFFEDFTGYDTWPDSSKWMDVEVYINNTMGVSPVSRGVATFDGLNAAGIPYNPDVRTALVYADSLTSKFIGLFPYFPSDSLYFSFFYQPAGNGFAPEGQDSLMLYFKKSNGAWIKVWSKEGSNPDSFKQVLIPIVDTAYMHDTFQFRFVNKASLNTNDDVWNIDYIKLDKGRNMYDTLINDVAMSDEPSFLLNDLTSMPYRQFIADPGKELASQHFATIKNGYNAPRSINYNYKAAEQFTGLPLGNGTTNSIVVVSEDKDQVSFPMYTTKPTLNHLYDNYTFDTKYYVEAQSPPDNPVNDTILKHQIFYNYMAYDDGTAEKSYFLNMFPTLPAKTAIEFHLNQPDTITGVSIYFGRQVPMAYNKYFSVFVYSDIGVNGGSENAVYSEDLLVPGYMRNDFTWTYKFTNPVPMPAGTFYIGTVQPAFGNADSLYLGLDVNRTGGNHLYYNVIGYWQPSTIDGAVMIRPMLGPVFAADVQQVAKPGNRWFANPNPVRDRLKIEYDISGDGTYWIADMQGKVILSGSIKSEQYLDVADLAPGVYIIRLKVGNQQLQPQKVIKY